MEKENFKKKIKEIFHKHCSGTIDEHGYCALYSYELNKFIDEITDAIYDLIKQEKEYEKGEQK